MNRLGIYRYFIYALLCIVPNQVFSQYLFPDWLAEEILNQGIPLYTTEPGVWNADVQGYTFHWEMYYSSSCGYELGTDFSVSGIDIEYSGCNSGYAEYVLGINWLAYFGSFPGGGVLASTSTLGATIEDMSNFVLGPISDIRESPSLQQRAEEKSQTTQSAMLLMGGQYESARYQQSDIKAYSIPIAYSKSIRIKGKLTQRGVFGNISYASFEGGRKVNIRATSFYKTEYRENIKIGALANLSLLMTSVEDGNIPAINVLGVGGFASYQNVTKDNVFQYSGGVLVEPKFGNKVMYLPIVFGGKLMLALSNLTTVKAELIQGFDPSTETEKDSYSKMSFCLDILGGIYSLGYQKAVGASHYSNTILFLHYNTIW